MCKLDDRVDWFNGSYTHTIAECVAATVSNATYAARNLPRRKRARCVVIVFDDTMEPAKITDRPTTFAAMLAKCDPFQGAA